MITYASKCSPHTFNECACEIVHCPSCVLCRHFLSIYLYCDPSPSLALCPPSLTESSLYMLRIYLYMTKKFYIVFAVILIPFLFSFFFVCRILYHYILPSFFLFCCCWFWLLMFLLLKLHSTCNVMQNISNTERHAHIPTHSLIHAIIMHVIFIKIYGLTIFRVSLSVS